MTSPVEARGFTLIELMIVLGLISVIAATAVPGLLRARISGNEASAIGSMRAMVSAQLDFAALTQGFADDLATLGSTCPGASTPFISSDLRSNGIAKSGYTFSVVPGAGAVAGPNDCFGNATQTAFYATAVPLSFGFSGSRAFAANSTATIWEDITGAAPTEPFTISPTVAPIGK
ncbi:MAG TPA: prepilin-type N-terminal cleavage/methylation domain-containing protein [Vicinamibacterales bacterium]|nr:prepilin-type N-terminal cleavage/methylation domain-containing protein [Vicinamibacterales bacterium]